MTAPTPMQFFTHLRWLDGRPLLDTIEPYRGRDLTTVLWSFRDDGVPAYNLALIGRGKKNWKTTDLALACLYRFVVWESPLGNDAYIVANDEDQAGDDLVLIRRLIEINPSLGAALEVQAKAIIRRDGRGVLRILPARDVAGAHGKSYTFLGIDEIHAYRNWDLLEALAPDPTRPDALQWVTSYDSVFNTPGVPLFDLKRAGITGDDPRMYFSWYSGDLCTDPSFAELEPEERANPSMASWPEGRGYLEQQRARLPTHKFRRLHLNLPGAPDGAFFDQGSVMAAIVSGRTRLPPEMGTRYVGFVDMSGGSADDATLGIAHSVKGCVVLDLVVSQNGRPPFDPRKAVEKFAGLCAEYGISTVIGDAYAGETFRRDFEAHRIGYRKAAKTRSELYEALEPRLNAGEVELLDLPKLQEQLLTLVMRGARIDHQPGDHDDWSNSAAGALWAATERRPMKISAEAMARASERPSVAAPRTRWASPSRPRVFIGSGNQF